MNYEKLVNNYKKQNEINFKLSFAMPKGYETAYGTYDVEKDTLFINKETLKNCSEIESVYYLFHELRHALQYNRKELFDEKIRNSINYVIMYNGIAYKLIGGQWKECKLDYSEEYLTNIYLSLPYELDANEFAYSETLKLFPNREKEIKKLYHDFWQPKELVDYTELIEIFNQIDKQL